MHDWFVVYSMSSAQLTMTKPMAGACGLYLGDVVVAISELLLKFSHQQCVYSVFKSHLFNCKEEWQLAWTFGQQVRRISFKKGLSFERTTPWVN
jgi:hypothetical protein